jgi:cytochrome-b5 reductase
MYQLARRILADPSDRTRICLLYANRTPADVLLRQELEELAVAYPDRFSLRCTVDALPVGEGANVNPAWTGWVGRMTADMVRNVMPAPDAGGDGAPFLALVCGPDGFLQHVAGAKGVDSETSQGPLGGILKDLGYRQQQVFKL